MEATIPHINSEANSIPPQCCLQVSETIFWHKLRCCYSVNMLHYWVGERSLIYFCKVDDFRISRSFSRNLLGRNNLCEILQYFNQLTEDFTISLLIVHHYWYFLISSYLMFCDLLFLIYLAFCEILSFISYIILFLFFI